MALLVRGELLSGTTAIAPDHEVVQDGAVLVEGERIAALGSYAQLRAQHPTAEELGSPRHLLLPGLVNAHDHARGLGTVQGGVADDALETWVLLLEDCLDVGPYLAALWTGIALIESGVTTTQHDFIPSAQGTLADGVLDALRAYETLGLRVAIGIPFFDQYALSLDEDAFMAGLPPDLTGPARQWAVSRAGLPMTEYRAVVTGLARTCRERYPRARLLVSPGGPWRCSDAMLVQLTEWARAEGLGRHLHLLETPYQRALGHRRHGGRTLVHALAGMGVLGPDLTCAHGVWLTEADIALLAEAGVSVAHNPSSNLRLRSGLAPVPALLAAGVNVGLGLDGTALNDDQDFIQEMRLCATLHACPRFGAPALRAEQVLRMATIAGAHAVLGPDDSPGRFEPGAPADLILVRQDRMRAPFTHPRVGKLELFLRRGKAEDVETVIVGGRVVLRDRQFSSIDRAAVAGQVAEAAARALRDSRDPPPWRAALLEHLRRFYQSWTEPAVEPYDTRNSRI